MNGHAGFIAAMGANPHDRITPVVYADWLDERADPRGKLLRVWVELSCFASHAGQGFCDLLTQYRQLLAGVDQAWVRRVGAARPWVSGPFAEELARGFFKHTGNPFPGKRVSVGGAGRFDEGNVSGWLVSYRIPDEYNWCLFVQDEFGWVYSFPTCGPRSWLTRYDVRAGQGSAF